MKIFYIIIFTILWISLTEASFKAEYLIISASVIGLCFAASYRLKLIPKRNGFNIKIIFYIFWLLKEILLSAINVSKIALSPNLKIKPSLEAIKVKQNTSLGLALYANSITLTPGTVTINTAAEGLLVHAIDYSVIEDLKEGEMDRRILSIIAKEPKSSNAHSAIQKKGE